MKQMITVVVSECNDQRWLDGASGGWWLGHAIAKWGYSHTLIDQAIRKIRKKLRRVLVAR
jgi:adenosylmethionine-8-amino-7-oxononanoate aminotransferase